MKSTSARPIRCAVAYTAIAVLVPVLGAWASPAPKARRGSPQRPRLLASPSRLADARRIAPGDRIERLVKLRIRGKGRFAAVYFQAHVKQTSLLDEDARPGIQIAIDRCSKRWASRRGAYSCPGKRFTVLAPRTLLGRVKLKRLGLRRRRTIHLRLVLMFPADAGDSFEAQVSRVKYSFVGLTRAG